MNNIGPCQFQPLVEQITELITSRPGILNIEIAEELGIAPEVVKPIIRSRIENSRIIVDKVNSLAGLMSAYRINSKWTPEDGSFIPLRSVAERDPDVPLKKRVGRPRKHFTQEEKKQRAYRRTTKRGPIPEWLKGLTISVESAKRVIRAFDGVRATARALDRNPTTVHRWLQSFEDGGNGGRVPRDLIPLILDIAASTGISITKEDLIEEPK